jgi:hypothetical protein
MFLNFDELIKCSRVCKKWNNSYKSGNIWKEMILYTFSTLNTESPKDNFYGKYFFKNLNYFYYFIFKIYFIFKFYFIF